MNPAIAVSVNALSLSVFASQASAQDRTAVATAAPGASVVADPAVSYTMDNGSYRYRRVR